MHNYSKNKPHDPHGFKEEVKIKYNAVKAVAGNFLNGTATMMELLAATAPPIDLAGYCQLTLPKLLIWEKRGNNLNKAMHFLMNSKNDNAKKELRLAQFQGNITPYPSAIKSMAKYL